VIAPVSDAAIRVPLCVPLSLKSAAFLFGIYGRLTIWALFAMETFTFDLLTLELADFRSRRPCLSLASFLTIILRLLRPSTLYLGPSTGQTDRQTDKETTAINPLCPSTLRMREHNNAVMWTIKCPLCRLTTERLHSHSVGEWFIQSAEAEPELVSRWTGVQEATQRRTSTGDQWRTGTVGSC